MGAIDPRAPHRQVRRRRQAAGDPGPQHPLRRPRHVHPPGRLVRLQPRLGAGRRRRRRRHRRDHDPRGRRRRDRPAMVAIWIKSGKPDVAMTANGMLAGLVGITAGCAAVSNWARSIIGGIAGVIVVVAVLLLRPHPHRRPGRRHLACTACAAPSARSRRPLRHETTTSGSRACSTAAGPTSSSPRSSASSRSPRSSR